MLTRCIVCTLPLGTCRHEVTTKEPAVSTTVSSKMSYTLALPGGEEEEEEEEEEWSQVASPGPREGHSLVALGDRLVMFGGKDGERYCGLHEMVDSTWRELRLEGGPEPRRGHVGLALGDSMLVFGGRGRVGFFGDSFLLLLRGKRWQRIQGPGPRARCDAACAAVGRRAFIFGGRDSKRCFGDLWIYDETWSQPLVVGSPPAPRFGHAMVRIGDLVLITGGERFDDEKRNTLSVKETEISALNEAEAVWLRPKNARDAARVAARAADLETRRTLPPTRAPARPFISLDARLLDVEAGVWRPASDVVKTSNLVTIHDRPLVLLQNDERLPNCFCRVVPPGGGGRFAAAVVGKRVFVHGSWDVVHLLSFESRKEKNERIQQERAREIERLREKRERGDAERARRAAFEAARSLARLAASQATERTWMRFEDIRSRLPPLSTAPPVELSWASWNAVAVEWPRVARATHVLLQMRLYPGAWQLVYAGDDTRYVVQGLVPENAPSGITVVCDFRLFAAGTEFGWDGARVVRSDDLSLPSPLATFSTRPKPPPPPPPKNAYFTTAVGTAPHYL
ncbi:hypothetical protein CTAYLR_000514 [Chrysophaeum taylorii]|uniref:Uncharacterized protein n=1 Tax=Chrysophaeum taylorii TaxID=2483200 RepID=A0AAD7UIB3_9STRA|nr:hypothetical protein CTAYLR_000514 [Chrysophaeum taylorii]